MQLLPPAPVASCAFWKYVSNVVFTAPLTGKAPPQFSDAGNDCGSLVLWSRER